jgi:hypothetical protein
MAKPNYSFEKRQRELAKKKKKEEKLKEKAGRKVGDNTPEDAPETDATDATGVATAPAPGQPAP